MATHSASMNNYRTLTAVNALFYVAIGVSAPLMTLYLASLGASYAQISLILTSYVLMLIAGNFAWGRVADHFGRRKPLLLIGLLCAAAGYALLSQSTAIAPAWSARSLEAVGMAAVTTVSLAFMGDTLEGAERKGRKMGLYRGIGSLAFSMGALAGGRVADGYSLALAFMLCSIFFLSAALLALLFLREDRRDQLTPMVTQAALEQTVPTEGCRRWRLSSDMPLLFLGGALLWTAAHSASTSMWPNYMASIGYTKTAIGSFWGLAAFIEMPAMFLAGTLSDLLGRATLLAAGSFTIALVQLGYLTVAGLLPALVGVQIVRGLGFGSYTAAALTFTAEQGEKASRGSNSGLFHMASSLGQLLGIFLGGQLVHYFGFDALYAICFALAVASGLCFLAMKRQRSRLAAVDAAPA